VSELDNPEIFRSIRETLPTGVYLVDRNPKIWFLNGGAENVTGHLQQDVVGHFLRENLLATDNKVKGPNLDPTGPVSVASRIGKATIGRALRPVSERDASFRPIPDEKTSRVLSSLRSL
jgi:PAS domain-containing protein